MRRTTTDRKTRLSTARRWRASLAVLGLLLPGLLHAAVFNVDPSTVSTDAVDVVPGDGSCGSAFHGCTLRAAIMEANATPGPDVIVLPEGAEIVLAFNGAGEDLGATGDLDITESVTITGNGATVRQSTVDRVLHVLPGAGTVTLEDLSVTAGFVLGGDGGGILHEGTNLVLNRVVVSENRSRDALGGGIFVAGGSLTVRDSSIRGNSTDSISGVPGALPGGGIAGGGALLLERTEIRFNRSHRSPGQELVDVDFAGNLGMLDVEVFDDTVRVSGVGSDVGLRNVTVTQGSILIETVETIFVLDNVDVEGRALEPHEDAVVIGGANTGLIRGGTLQGTFGTAGRPGTRALRNAGTTTLERVELLGRLSDVPVDGNGGCVLNQGTLTVIESLIRNCSTQFSGALANDHLLRMVNSTITSSRANGSGAGLVNQGTAELSNVTITANTADFDADGNGDGGGVKNAAGATLILRNSIVAGNTDASPKAPSRFDDCFGELDSDGHNLVGRSFGCQLVGDPTGNLVNVSAELEALAQNGGPTRTHALAETSPAVDAGDPLGCLDHDGSLLSDDQRGRPRPGTGPDVRCDVGAFELSPPEVPLFADGFESGDATAWSVF